MYAEESGRGAGVRDIPAERQIACRRRDGHARWLHGGQTRRLRLGHT